ncbi:MAG: hypothetical protein LBV41_06090 [Cytophagaceae bacterium]|nr:hypothetical protein [Cytophagaceae bacterium]
MLINEILAKDTVLTLVYGTRLFSDHTNNTEVGFVDAHTGNKSGTVQFNVSSPSNSIYYLHVYDEVNGTPEVQ